MNTGDRNSVTYLAFLKSGNADFTAQRSRKGIFRWGWISIGGSIDLGCIFMHFGLLQQGWIHLGASTRKSPPYTPMSKISLHLLISSLLLAALMLYLKICPSGWLPIGYRSIQTRRNLSGSALPSNFRSLTSPSS